VIADWQERALAAEARWHRTQDLIWELREENWKLHEQVNHLRDVIRREMMTTAEVAADPDVERWARKRLLARLAGETGRGA
jgi:hypothetical protein